MVVKLGINSNWKLFSDCQPRSTGYTALIGSWAVEIVEVIIRLLDWTVGSRDIYYFGYRFGWYDQMRFLHECKISSPLRAPYPTSASSTSLFTPWPETGYSFVLDWCCCTVLHVAFSSGELTLALNSSVYYVSKDLGRGGRFLSCSSSPYRLNFNRFEPGFDLTLVEWNETRISQICRLRLASPYFIPRRAGLRVRTTYIPVPEILLFLFYF